MTTEEMKSTLEGREEEQLEVDLQSSNNSKDNYLIILAKFSYGSRIKNYGFLNIVVDFEVQALTKVILLLGSNKDIWDINLNPNLFRGEIDELNDDSNYRADDFKSKLKESLDIQNLIELSTLEQTEELNGLVKENIEDIIQEQINLKMTTTYINQEELNNIYPELKVVEEVDLNDVELGEESSNTSKEKLNLDIELKCTPVISAVKGKKIDDLDLGDEIFVKITDQREVSNSIADLLGDNPKELTGKIVEVNFNQELDRYNVLVQFKPNIYGNLVVEPELKIKANKVIENSLNTKDNNQEIKFDKDLMIISAIVLTIIILLSVIIGVSF
ncbi:hypothetical protein [Orenia marismortui]|uniref:Uncharacterized protein n=1 Tax=Orenia marismortui TaxID=46469 RepID=A0A4R8GYE9_9FIRM|nr:hypothetical protein [Orenia marismortui]TDX48904.1 hypothetical protein C7959_12415 [Orenia marismortui]